MSTFYIKRRDTRPILEAALKNGDGTAYDLTGAGSVTLHILTAGGTLVSKAMSVYGAPTNGVVRYTFLAADWTDIPASPSTLRFGDNDHRMEIEVVNGTLRLTFPNDGYDTLRVTDDLGQA